MPLYLRAAGRNIVRVVGIIPVRMDSNRLPGKALRHLGGSPLIGHVVSRARRIDGVESVVIATTSRSIDEPLLQYARRENISFCCGAADDVAHRVLECAKEYDAEYFLRINGDSPFVDPLLITKGIEECRELGADFVSNIVGRTFPYGISVEIVATRVFETCYRKMQSDSEREHVTSYLYAHLSDHRVHLMQSHFPEVAGARLVIDDAADLARMEALWQSLGDCALTAEYQEVARRYLSLFPIDNTAPVCK